MPEVLYDVAAIVTSVTLGPVAEAFGVHEINGFATSLSQPYATIAPPDAALRPSALAATLPYVPTVTLPDAPPLPFIGPDSAAGPSDNVTGARLLEQLSLLSPSGMTSWLAAHPDTVPSLLESPPPARDVTLWWQGLDYSSRLALRTETPQLVGNLDGVPFSERDIANRAVLTSTMSELAHVIDTESGRTVVENAKQQLHMLQSISDSLGVVDPTSVAPGRTLMTLDVTGQGRAAIVLGDLRTADYVSYMVPGMFFTIENQMGDWVDAAARLHDEELSWLALLGPGAGTAGVSPAPARLSGVPVAAPTVATIAWIGYHTPNLTNVGGIENAYEGRDSLAGAIRGLQSLRIGDEPYITVIAHSYGSTAALMALTEYDFEIDALAMVGSPGSPAKSIDELHVRNGNVYVGEAAWDPIPNSSYFGSDPGAKSYGAKPMGVGGGVDALSRQALASSIGHNEYFSPGTESMRNFALISIGQGGYVSSGS